jgi:hypothetical protein
MPAKKSQLNIMLDPVILEALQKKFISSLVLEKIEDLYLSALAEMRDTTKVSHEQAWKI